MKLIVGLGNPGKQYVSTRHNLGKNLMLYAAEKHALKFSEKSKFHAWVTDFSWEDEKVCFAIPTTYMNLSGQAVSALANYFGIDITEDLLIVIDDFAIPFGRVRLRPDGSSGGHNGLKSVDQALSSTSYARLRLGIAPIDEKGEVRQIREPLEKFVLAGFASDEQEKLEAIFLSGYEALELWVNRPIEEAMGVINTAK